MTEARDIISKIEVLFLELKQKLNIDAERGVKKNVHKVAPKISGVAGEILTLAHTGFFAKPKSLSEIQSKLQDEGVNKPTTALMDPILRLIRKKILARAKSEKGQYQYYLRNNN